MSNRKKRSKKLRKRRDNSPLKLGNIEIAALESTVRAVTPPGNPVFENLIAQEAFPAVRSGIKAFEKTKSIQHNSPMDSVKAMLLTADRQISKGISCGSNIPACGPGCSFCCQNMNILFHEEEAAIIAEAIAMLEPSRVAALTQRLSLLGPTGSGKGVGQCALLGEDGKCSIYDSRPMVCRAYHSTSQRKCKDRLDGTETNIGTYTTLAFLSDRASLHSFLAVSGSSQKHYSFEMNSFLKRILKFDGRLEKWASGVFLDESDICVRAPKNPLNRNRKLIPLLLIEEKPSITKKQGLFIFIKNIFCKKKQLIVEKSHHQPTY